MKSILTLITFSTALCAFVFISCKSKIEIPTEPIPKSLHYLALGDSYTIGQSVADSLRWPVQLSENLRAKDYSEVYTEIIAQTGWTTGDLLNAIPDAEREQYNLVSLLIGVNNQYQNKPFEMFNTEFDSLLNKSIEFAAGKEKVFVVSIPDYGVTPFGSNNSEEIAQELDTYNEYMNQKCIDLGIPFINITEISRELGASVGSLAPDNLHPSGSQYTKWVEEILPIVEEILMD